jgi:hypothetical protein
MTMDAIERVPMTDWLMGLVVLGCGVAGIIAVWRYCDQLGGFGAALYEEPNEGDGPGDEKRPLALPSGPSNGRILPDQIDEELWNIIEVERRRISAGASPERVERIAARALEAVADAGDSPSALRHVSRRHLRARQDGQRSGSTNVPRVPEQARSHAYRSKRRAWATRTDR